MTKRSGPHDRCWARRRLLSIRARVTRSGCGISPGGGSNFGWGVFGSGRSGSVILPGENEQQADTDTDGAVRYVKGRESGLLPIAAVNIKEKKIDDMPHAHSVDKVADDSTKDQAEGDLSCKGASVEVMARPDEDHERSKCDEGEDTVVSAEHAPGGAGVDPVDELEKPIDDDFFLGVAEVFQDQELCELVEADDQQGHECDPPVGIE